MFSTPNIISLARLFLLVPMLYVLTWMDSRVGFLLGFGVCLFSDWLDGFVARRMKQVTRLGAKLDSWADWAMYISVLPCAFLLWPEVIRREALFVAIVVVSYLVPDIVGLIKFRRIPSFHSWAAKGAAVLMAVSMFLLLAGISPWPFRIGSLLFVLQAIEEIAMTLILPEWQTDVPTIWHALRLRRGRHPAAAVPDAAFQTTCPCRTTPPPNRGGGRP